MTTNTRSLQQDENDYITALEGTSLFMNYIADNKVSTPAAFKAVQQLVTFLALQTAGEFGIASLKMMIDMDVERWKQGELPYKPAFDKIANTDN